MSDRKKVKEFIESATNSVEYWKAATENCNEAYQALQKELAREQALTQKHREKNLARYKKHHKSLDGRFSIYKNSAKKKKIQFKLSLDEFKDYTSSNCYYYNGKSFDRDYVGIDRIDY